MKNKRSFTAASTLPAKLITDTELVDSVKRKYIPPIHIQINPTNKCPYSCTFCSCGQRDLSQSYDIDKFKTMMDEFKKLGTKAVTITGGGDPLAYKHFSEMLDYIINVHGMEAAMVTNGFMFPQFKDDKNIEKMTWCRISVYDEYPFRPEKIEETIARSPDVDWAFSYVVTEKYDYENLRKCLSFANLYKDRFSHVRVVSDILNLEVGLGDVQEKLAEEGIDTSLCIWQGRKDFVHGAKRCMISLMKPNIDPAGEIYGCCGIQYARNPKGVPLLDFDFGLTMGSAFKEGKIWDIWNNQKYFDGSKCDKCYYNSYNDALSTIWDEDGLTHKNFI